MAIPLVLAQIYLCEDSQQEKHMLHLSHSRWLGAYLWCCGVYATRNHFCGCMTYSPITMMKHHGQGNFEKEGFAWIRVRDVVCSVASGGKADSDLTSSIASTQREE